MDKKSGQQKYRSQVYKVKGDKDQTLGEVYENYMQVYDRALSPDIYQSSSPVNNKRMKTEDSQMTGAKSHYNT